MATRLRRYEFSERLADILGESRRDLRFRVTLLVSAGLIPPGPRGPGSPPADPAYAANLLIGVMAAPQQAQTVEAIRCYRDLAPTTLGGADAGPRVVVGAPGSALRLGPPPTMSLVLADRPRFGDAITRLLEHAASERNRERVAHELFGVWVSRGFPVAAIQLAALSEGHRAVITQRYELAEGSRPPAWLDPGRGGGADPGLLHSVFLPTGKLIQIAALTTPRHERTAAVIDLGQTLSDLAHLARKRGQRRPWEKFLEKASVARAFAEDISAKTTRLTEVAEFGSNPGNLRMLTYVPEGLPKDAPLVVVLHGCTQTAASFDAGVGWTTLADRYGFAVLLPEQRRRNNPLRCFNWFKAEDTDRNQGEALSIRQMVERMAADQGADRSRIYATGLSAGGAMTSAMLATYPDVFAGGAVIAGVPYRSANGLQEGFDVIFQGRTKSPREWGDLVRAASTHPGPWPKVSVWHGAADGTVTPANAEEIVKQWADVHGLSLRPTVESSVDGHGYRVWRDGDDTDLIECYTIEGMSHGAPIHPGDGEGQCGSPAPFIVDMGISSSHHIARFWGLTEPLPGWVPVPRRPAEAASPPAQDASEVRPADADIVAATQTEDGDDDEPMGGSRFGARQGVDLQTILAKTLQSTAALRSEADSTPRSGQAAPSAEDEGKPDDDARTESGPPTGAPLGIDIQSILTKSFQAAGLLKAEPESTARRRSQSSLPLGIDLQQILETSFEAAGLLRSRRTQARPSPDTGDTHHRSPAASADEAAGTADAERTVAEKVAGVGWVSEGWQLHGRDPGGAESGPVLYGHASSGSEQDVGNKVRSVSCRLALGQNPQLTYTRRLDLRAAVNMFTKATFRVVVDGIAVDEVSATGMDYSEAEWTERADIDLARFAGRTITLTFEVTAHSNVFIEAFAKAWLRDISFRDAVQPAQA